MVLSMQYGVACVQHTGVFATEDTRLAAFLALRGYGDPVYEVRQSKVWYLFEDVRQEDILVYCNNDAVLISPFALFQKHRTLVESALHAL